MIAAMRITIVVCILSTPIVSYAQNNPYQLSSGEYSVDIGLVSAEDVVALNGGLNYGISRKYSGFLAGGFNFIEEQPWLSSIDISMPPSPHFSIGISEIGRLGQTGFDHYSTVAFAVGFGKFVDDVTDETIMTSRAMTLGVSIGFIKNIVTESGFVFTPLVAILFNSSWITAESDYTYFDEDEWDDNWGGGISFGVARLLR